MMIREIWKINKPYKAVILSIFIIIGIIFGSVQLLDYIDSKTHITVPGTVYGKYVGQEHHKHYTNDIFIMAVHPYDKNIRITRSRSTTLHLRNSIKVIILPS